MHFASPNSLFGRNRIVFDTLSEPHILKAETPLDAPPAQHLKAECTEQQYEGAPASARTIDYQGWKVQAFVTDVATMGTGTLLAAVLNTALVFLIPRLVSIEDFGYWRMFLLYSGYAGFMHLGLADGALLRWAGRPMADFHHEILPSLKFLFWLHLAVLAPTCMMLAFVLPSGLRLVGLAVAAFALVINPITLLQYSLQAGKIFRPVAISAVAPLGVFLGCVLLWKLVRPYGFGELIVFWFLAWSFGFAFLVYKAAPWKGRTDAPAQFSPKDYLRAGWPIVAANGGVVLILLADRMALSWAVTIQEFAQYSLAASALSVPVTVIQACYRVFLPHVAALDSDSRKRTYKIASRFLLIAWSLLLPYYFALDAFVRRFLPQYVPSLQIARLLLLGILFLGAIQILQMSFAYLHGRQSRFLMQTGPVVIITLAAMSLTAFTLRSLTAVATVQVVVLGVWWLFNEWTLRDLTGLRLRDSAKFLGVFTWAAVTYWLTTRPEHTIAASLAIYYAVLSIALLIWCRQELRFCGLVLRRM